MFSCVDVLPPLKGEWRQQAKGEQPRNVNNSGTGGSFGTLIFYGGRRARP